MEGEEDPNRNDILSNADEPVYKKAKRAAEQDTEERVRLEFSHIPMNVREIVLQYYGKTEASIGLTLLRVTGISKEYRAKFNTPAVWQAALKVDFPYLMTLNIDWPKYAVERLEGAPALPYQENRYKRCWMILRWAFGRILRGNVIQTDNGKQFNGPLNPTNLNLGVDLAKGVDKGYPQLRYGLVEPSKAMYTTASASVNTTLKDLPRARRRARGQLASIITNITLRTIELRQTLTWWVDDIPEPIIRTYDVTLYRRTPLSRVVTLLFPQVVNRLSTNGQGSLVSLADGKKIRSEQIYPNVSIWERTILREILKGIAASGDPKAPTIVEYVRVHGPEWLKLYPDSKGNLSMKDNTAEGSLAQQMGFFNYLHRNIPTDEKGKLMILCSLSGCIEQATLKCSGCNLEYYCSKRCQQQHWRQQHQHKCKR